MLGHDFADFLLAARRASCTITITRRCLARLFGAFSQTTGNFGGLAPGKGNTASIATKRRGVDTTAGGFGTASDHSAVDLRPLADGVGNRGRRGLHPRG